MKILVTGFDPFGGDTTKPAIEAVVEFDGKEDLKMVGGAIH